MSQFVRITAEGTIMSRWWKQNGRGVGVAWFIFLLGCVMAIAVAGHRWPVQ